MTGLPILSTLIFLPAVAAFILPFLSGNNTVRWFTFIILFVDFLIATWLLVIFDNSTAQMQFMESRPWVPSLGITYKLGIDGVSVLFVFLTALLGWICVLASWNAIRERLHSYVGCDR